MELRWLITNTSPIIKVLQFRVIQYNLTYESQSSYGEWQDVKAVFEEGIFISTQNVYDE